MGDKSPLFFSTDEVFLGRHSTRKFVTIHTNRRECRGGNATFLPPIPSKYPNYSTFNTQHPYPPPPAPCLPTYTPNPPVPPLKSVHKIGKTYSPPKESYTHNFDSTNTLPPLNYIEYDKEMRRSNLVVYWWVLFPWRNYRRI